MLSKTILLSLAALATSALASPTVRTDSYYWTVERFTSTCTAATCRYDFNVTGAYGPLSQPSFDAYGCDGETGPGTFEPCATLGIDVPGSVKTKELNLGDKANVFVEFSFEQEGKTYTYTGNETVSHTNGGGPSGFTIIPNTVSVVG